MMSFYNGLNNRKSKANEIKNEKNTKQNLIVKILFNKIVLKMITLLNRWIRKRRNRYGLAVADKNIER